MVMVRGERGEERESHIIILYCPCVVSETGWLKPQQLDHWMWPSSSPPSAQSLSPVLGCGTYTPIHPAESGERSITSKYICLHSLSISIRLWNWSINLRSYLSRSRQQTPSISVPRFVCAPVLSGWALYWMLYLNKMTKPSEIERVVWKKRKEK